MENPFLLSAVITIASLSSALIALWVLARYVDPAKRQPGLAPDPEPTVFLFDGDRLQDATAPARALLGRLAEGASDRDRVIAHLARAIPDLETRLVALGAEGRIEASVGSTDIQLVVEQIGGCERFTLTDLSAEGQYALVDCLSHRAMQNELSALREIVENLPLPLWRQAPGGSVTWANAAYLRLAGNDDPQEALSWPLPELFAAGPAHSSVGQWRRMLTGPDGKVSWHDCEKLASASGEVGVALPATPLVRAEKALRDFIQTLTKTFADLPIGLAIFDRDRQLALFNPALIDLTTLDGEFLSARPTLFSFLDRLRESRILPEPKDYGTWRQQMLALEHAASTGQYEETWPLPTGQTYRVTGRPHPEGAIAFLIEDITSEISLTRRFRAEVELAQSTLNAIDDGLAVFSRTGDLILSNDTLADLWDYDPRPSLGTVTIIDAVSIWRSHTQASDLWEEVIDYTRDTGERAPWDGHLTLPDGHDVTIRVAPMARGATLVRFARGHGHRLTVRHSQRRIGAQPPGLPA